MLGRSAHRDKIRVLQIRLHSSQAIKFYNLDEFPSIEGFIKIIPSPQSIASVFADTTQDVTYHDGIATEIFHFL